AMIVDSTALPEQAVRDIVASAFQSAGQRCSALRVLYVQEDVEERILTMLKGAMEALVIGDPWQVSTDLGPVIDEAAKARIMAHVDKARADGRVLSSVGPSDGLFVPPTVIRVSGIGDLDEEIFGPVLHVARFDGARLEGVVDEVNGAGYGLTFGLHTRIDDRVEAVVQRVAVGNTYVNRNQIGAVVGSQPFGGEGLSGTGPKAGGPRTVKRLSRRAEGRARPVADNGGVVPRERIAKVLSSLRAEAGPRSVVDLPGPTGESNRLSTVPRGVIVCAGPTPSRAKAQADAARAAGNGVLVIAPGASGSDGPHLAHIDGTLNPADLAHVPVLDAVVYDGPAGDFRRALAERSGPIVPLLTLGDDMDLERHLCIDTAAAGGNARLLSATEDGAEAALHPPRMLNAHQKF
ncbi:MAG: aldehyde dehydrogenase family protein, partial [Pseudomonadota bacterium]